jgi:segregation and condensation protein B
MEEKEMQPEGASLPPESPSPEPAAPEAAETIAEPPEISVDEISMDELLAPSASAGAAEPEPAPDSDLDLKAVLEAVVYIADEPLTVAQMAAALSRPAESIQAALDELIAEFDGPGHGIAVREVAGGYKMATKAEHHEAVRNFVKGLNPPLKLSLPALETLAVIAYKQPVTGPEIMEIRGVQGGGVMKTLLDRKLIAVAGRKNVIGKPMLYKTTKEFLIQFGLKDLAELPSLKEFEEIRRMAFSDSETAPGPDAEVAEAVVETGVETIEADTPEGGAEAANSVPVESESSQQAESPEPAPAPEPVPEH